MRFLLDQDVYDLTARFLTEIGHDLVVAADAGLSTAPDIEVLRAAQADRRILVTRDRHFGGLVFASGHNSGVIYLRVTPSTLVAVHRELEELLTEQPESVLARAFVVVEPGRYRLRHPLAS